MELQRDLVKDRLHFGISQVHIDYNSINKRSLGEFIGSIFQFLDVDSNVVGWMALVFNVEPSALDFGNHCFELVIILAQENPIVNVNHEYDVVSIENTIINEGRLESNGVELVNKLLIPYSTSLLLAIDVLEEFEHMILGFSLRGSDSLW